MRKINIAVTIGLILTSAAGAYAQDTAAKAPAESVLKHIPAGAMAYIAVNNIQETAAKVEKFGTKIGVIPPQPADAKKDMFVPMIRQLALLSDGFNPNAGAGVVLLDVKQFGINLPELALSGIAGAELSEKNAKALKAGLPFVLYVPGSSIKGVFGKYPIQTDGGLTSVKLRMGKMFAAKTGGYVILSPNKDALKAVTSAAKKADSELSKDEAALVKRNDIVYHIDFKPFAETFSVMMKEVGKQAAKDDPTVGPMLQAYCSMFAELGKQIDTETGGIRIDKAGVVAEAIDTAKTGGTLAKSWDEMGKIKTRGGASILDSLPSLPYVLAVGMSGQPGSNGSSSVPASAEFISKLIDDIMKTEPMASKLSKETKAKTKKTIAGLMEELGEVQFVGGGAPAGNGMFGMAWSIKCKDSAKLKALLADKADLAQTFITKLIDDQDAKALKITYKKGVEKCGDIPVDAIEISHPEMLTMNERDRASMARTLGEDKIRFLVAAPNKTTVVVTFAGSTAMTAKTIAAVGGKGPIAKDPGTVEVLKSLPKDPHMLALVNISNLMDVIRTGVAASVEDPQNRQMVMAMIPNIACKTPVAVGAKFKKNTAHGAMVVPTNLVRDMVPIVKQAMMLMMMGGMAAPQQGGPGGPPADDF